MVKAPRDGWDQDEREMLGEFAGEFAALRQRHLDDPPLEVLRAARANVLPADVQAIVGDHLDRSPWSRALVDGCDEIDVTAPERLRARVRRTVDLEAERHHGAGVQGRAGLQGAFWWTAAAAVLLLGVVIGLTTNRSAPPAPSAPVDARLPDAAPAPTPAPATPEYVLALEKPAVTLSAATLTFRGAAGELAGDLKPAIDAFRADDYARTIQELAPLYARYPSAVEVPYYEGVSRIFVGDVNGAAEKLESALALADSAFAPDVLWYLAVAEERAGRSELARNRLLTLCRQATSARAEAACAAADRLR